MLEEMANFKLFDGMNDWAQILGDSVGRHSSAHRGDVQPRNLAAPLALCPGLLPRRSRRHLLQVLKLPELFSSAVDSRQGDQMIWEKSAIFLKVAKTVAKQNNAKLQTLF
jgi:hypothetical protein